MCLFVAFADKRPLMMSMLFLPVDQGSQGCQDMTEGGKCLCLIRGCWFVLLSVIFERSDVTRWPLEASVLKSVFQKSQLRENVPLL